MDSICLKAGIPGIAGGYHVSTAASAEKPSVSAAAPYKNRPAPLRGFSFKYPLRSLWPKKKYDAIALDDAVLVEEREPAENNRVEMEMIDDEREEVVEREGNNNHNNNGNWVLKILQVRSVWGNNDNSNNNDDLGNGNEELEGKEEENDEVCRLDDDDNKVEFDRGSFSKMLRRVSLAEARLYAKMSYLGNLAYCIPQIKPKNLLKIHGLRFVTSSLEKKEMAMKAEKEKEPVEEVEVVKEAASNELEKNQEQQENKSSSSRLISPSTAYHIAASAASYLHAHTKSIVSFRSPKTESGEISSEENRKVNLMDNEMASLMATTDSMTAVVAAKEEVKQAVADDLNSTLSSPCDWFICDDDLSGTRYFVIQGSESIASWQANLLFEPIQFEGLDVPVHRGIYEAAKGIYEQMLPEVRAHLESRGKRATFRFTGHSLGGSLALLINLMLLKRGEVPISSLLPVITFGAPSIMCGGDRLLKEFGLPRSHVQSIAMHRDIVPRAFSCNYPGHVAELLKAVNGNFRNHPCLNNQKMLYAPMGEFLILQPDEKHSPNHDLLPPGSGLYLLISPASNVQEPEKQFRAALSLFLNSPHPLEILSDRSAYGSDGTVQRDHDMNSYLKSVRSVIRQELNQIRRARREDRRKIWWPLVDTRGLNGPVVSRNMGPGPGPQQFNFGGILQNGTRSLKRFTRLVTSQNVHLLVVLLFPARLLILGTYSVINLVI